MKKELTALLVAGFLSCSAPQHYNPKIIAINISGVTTSIIEDSDNDGRLDSIYYYSILEKINLGSSDDRDDDYFILKFEGKERWNPPFQKNQLSPVPIPKYKNKNSKDNLKMDVRSIF